MLRAQKPRHHKPPGKKLAVPYSIKEEEWQHGALPREGDEEARDEEKRDFFSSLTTYDPEHPPWPCDGYGEECPGCNRCTAPGVGEGAEMFNATKTSISTLAMTYDFKKDGIG